MSSKYRVRRTCNDGFNVWGISDCSRKEAELKAEQTRIDHERTSAEGGGENDKSVQS